MQETNNSFVIYTFSSMASWKYVKRELERDLEKVYNYQDVDIAKIEKEFLSIPTAERTQLSQQPGPFGNSVLHDGAYNGNTKLVEAIIYSIRANERAQVLATQNDFYNNTPLDLATINNHTATIKAMMGAVNRSERLGLVLKQKKLGTVLHTAASRGHCNGIKCILDELENDEQITLLSVVNKSGQTALEVTKINSNTDAAACLQSYEKSSLRETIVADGMLLFLIQVRLSVLQRILPV